MKNPFRLIRNGESRFKLITNFHLSGIALSFDSFMLLMLFCFLLINGCKKDKPSSDDQILQGNQAFHASAVAGYQTLGAGVSYPFKALKLASPTGSLIHSLSNSDKLLTIVGSALHERNSDIAASLEFVPYLNLYGGYEFNGNILLMSFYSDAAGTQSAGNIIVTLPTDITNPLDPTSYASYPAKISIDLNVTGGNLPCKGSLLIIFTGGSGANTMTGSNTLTRDNVVFTLNLALNDQMNATGSITIQESGATIEATNVQGPAFGDLTCDITINPYGWTGTGVLNLITGLVYAQVNTGNGTSTATSDSLGNLNISYADGTHEIVVNALAGGLTGSGTQTGTPASIIATSGTPQSTVVNTTFASPLVATVKDKNGNPVSGVTVNFTTPSTGQSCTFAGEATTHSQTTNSQGQVQIPITANAVTGSYNVIASVSGITETAIFSLTNTSGSNTGYDEPIFFSTSQRTIVSINNSGKSIGYLPPPAGSGYNIPVFWSSLTGQPATIKIYEGDSSAALNGFNDNGAIVGNGYYNYPNGDQAPTRPLYWSDPTALPLQLAVPANTNFAIATNINNSGQIVGFAITSSNSVSPLYWASPTEVPEVLQTLAGTMIAPKFIGANGNIIAGFVTSYDHGYNVAFWANHTAQPSVLNGLTGSVIINPISVNAAGLIVGYCQDLNNQTPVTWADANALPQALPQPEGSVAPGINIATSINTAGVIVGSYFNGYGGGACTIWKNGQAMDLAFLMSNQNLGPAQLITDQGWILGTAYLPDNQYIIIPK
jgi:hypothetical protein